MRPVKCWQVDAFTDRRYRGNSAAVCWLEEEVTPHLRKPSSRLRGFSSPWESIPSLLESRNSIIWWLSSSPSRSTRCPLILGV